MWSGPHNSLQTDVARIHFVVSVLGLPLIGGGAAVTSAQGAGVPLQAPSVWQLHLNHHHP